MKFVNTILLSALSLGVVAQEPKNVIMVVGVNVSVRVVSFAVGWLPLLSLGCSRVCCCHGCCCVYCCCCRSGCVCVGVVV